MPQTKLQDPVAQSARHVDSGLQTAASVLLIDAPDAMRLLSGKPGVQTVVLTKKSMLSRKMIASVKPDAIIGPLIARDWDIVDLGMALETLGYRGDLYALTQPLPRAELVIREVGALCRALRVRLLETA